MPVDRKATSDRGLRGHRTILVLGNGPADVPVRKLLGDPVRPVVRIAGFGKGIGALGFHWSLAAKELMSTPPILRLMGIGESSSTTAKELHANDPNRKLRSFALPFPSSSRSPRRHREGLGLDRHRLC